MNESCSKCGVVTPELRMQQSYTLICLDCMERLALEVCTHCYRIVPSNEIQAIDEIDYACYECRVDVETYA
jgi:hypothetical protein